MSDKPDGSPDDDGNRHLPTRDQDADGASHPPPPPASSPSFETKPFDPASKPGAWAAPTIAESALPPAETQAASRDASGDSATTEPQTTAGDWDKLPAPVFEVGRVVFGKYRLQEKIGEGGMGEVWKVHNVELDRTSALKLIKPEIAHNDKGWTRFQREARLMAKLNHPNAVAVYDFRRTQSMGYIEMEFIRGRSLDQVLKEHPDKPLTLDWTVQIVDQLCSVLHEAHGHEDEKTGKSKPIIHRDLKPSNLMLADRKQPGREIQLKVLDFGIAKMVEDEGNPEVTGANDMIGTPAYMSPEQIRGGFEGEGEEEVLDGRSDLYSTGVMLYQLVSGVLPFRGSRMAMLAAHLNNKPPPIKDANPQANVSSAVERVVMQCLEKEPAQRPQSARELAEKFRQAAGIAGGPGIAAPSRTLPWPKLAGAILIVGLAVGALIPIAGMFRKPSAAPVENPPSEETASVVPPKPPAIAPSTTTPLESWVPAGFAIAEPKDLDKATSLPKTLVREDGALFIYYKDGMYLPKDYKADDSNRTAGQWPRAIVRTSDQARFIRIDGGMFRRGDPREQTPVDDTPGNPLKPHYVRVRGFYIQETEVTNGEIKAYRVSLSDDENGLRKWSQCYEDIQKAKGLDDEAMNRLPAVCVGYRLASQFAASVGGFLPTEAQWEYAAKSRQNDNLSAWGKESPWAGVARGQSRQFPGRPHPGQGEPQGQDRTGRLRHDRKRARALRRRVQTLRGARTER